MAYHYHCRHCGLNVGTIHEPIMRAEQLGFNHLTNEERQEMIHYDDSGDLYVKTICEDCQEALQRNPDLHQMDFLIQ